MKHFFLYKIIPAFTLISFILLMNSGTVLKKPLGANDNVPKYFNLLQTSISANQWPEAGRHLKKMESAWRKVIPRIQFSEERDEINNFRHSLARINGFVAAQEKAGALAEIKELQETWNDLGE